VLYLFFFYGIKIASKICLSPVVRRNRHTISLWDDADRTGTFVSRTYFSTVKHLLGMQALFCCDSETQKRPGGIYCVLGATRSQSRSRSNGKIRSHSRPLYTNLAVALSTALDALRDACGYQQEQCRSGPTVTEPMK